MIKTAFHLSSYSPLEAHRDSVPVEPPFILSLQLTFTDFLSLYRPLFSLIFRVFSGSTPFVVGISIRELDCGYQREAGGHVWKSQQQTHWRKAKKQ